MVGDALNNLANASLDFLIHLGRIALIVLLYFSVAFLITKVIIRRLKNSPILTRYGKNGSMIAFRLITIGVYLIATIGVLSNLGVDTTGILTLASAFTVAIGLALQDVMRNLISGLFMLAEKPFSVGDRVKVRDRVGTVQGIDIRTTMLRTDEGALLMVPNQLMFTEILQNSTRFNMRMITYEITTSMPAEKLLDLISDAIKDIPSIRPPLDPPILIEHAGESTRWSVSFAVNAKQMTHEYEIGDALLKALPESTITRAGDE